MTLSFRRGFLTDFEFFEKKRIFESGRCPWLEFSDSHEDVRTVFSHMVLLIPLNAVTTYNYNLNYE